MMTSEFTVRDADFARDFDAIRSIRETVFVHEQQVPLELEWDEADKSAYHVLAVSSAGAAIGTARLLADAHIGRMSVLASWRGRGVGSALLEHLLDVARRRGFTEVFLSAQVHALEFYRRHGFECRGEPYLEAGIPHRAMARHISAGENC